MISYFKHTNGESFTLDGNDYVGFFHVLSGSAFTEKLTTSDSLSLLPKETMISNIYSNELEFDTTYKGISKIRPYYSNVFDILNKDGLDKLTGSIDSNNLICFKNLVLGNPTIFNYEENDCFYYGLSTLSEESEGSLPIKDVYSHIEVLENSQNWGFLDNIVKGTLVVDSYENFKYLCSDNTAVYTLSGNFSTKSPLTKIKTVGNSPYYDITHQLHYDAIELKMFFVKNDVIEVYDASNYETCHNLLLIDKINLTPTITTEYKWNTTDIKFGSMQIPFSTKFTTVNTNNPEFIKFGKNVRTGIDGTNLYIINKHSTEVYQSIPLSDLGDISDIDIRNTDDCILILNRKEDGLYVCFLDPTNYTNTLTNTRILSIEDALPPHVRFSDVDSNVFYTYNSLEYQSRYISNPSYPSGRLETCDLDYLKKYIWDTTDEQFKFVDVCWNSDKLPSNSYNNLTVSSLVKNNKMFMLLHNIGRVYAISQPMNDRFLNALPLDLPKYFNYNRCSESSLGLYFNTSISNIVKDTLNMLNSSKSSFTIYEYSVLSREIEEFIEKTQNLYINGNETINVASLQRILLVITKIQKKLLPSSG